MGSPDLKCNAAFKRAILLRCYDALERAGFTRKRQENVEWPLGGEFFAWVGLNTGLYPDQVSINPFVGVHARAIDKMCAELEATPYPGRYGPAATYAIHLGEVPAASSEPVFAFTPWQSEAFVEAEIERLARLYATIGLAYARSIGDYETLLPLLLSRVPMLGGYPQRVACCLYLMNQKSHARRFIEQLPSDSRSEISEFITPFLARLKADGG